MTRILRLLSLLLVCCAVTARAQNTVFNAALTGDVLDPDGIQNMDGQDSDRRVSVQSCGGGRVLVTFDGLALSNIGLSNTAGGNGSITTRARSRRNSP